MVGAQSPGGEHRPFTTSGPQGSDAPEPPGEQCGPGIPSVLERNKEWKYGLKAQTHAWTSLFDWGGGSGGGRGEKGGAGPEAEDSRAHPNPTCSLPEASRVSQTPAHLESNLSVGWELQLIRGAEHPSSDGRCAPLPDTGLGTCFLAVSYCWAQGLPKDFLD